MSNTVISVKNRDGALRVIASLPQLVVSQAGLSGLLLERAGRTLLARIRTAFVAKSRGGTDEAGDRWEPLAPATVAARVRGFAARDARRVPRKFDADPLTQKQAEWWSLYRSALRGYGGDRNQAALHAWHRMRGTRAPTIAQQYANRRVDILKDTGALLASLSPGSPTGLSVFRVEAGSVTMGTARPHALAHHLGVPSRNLPQRRLWPAPDRWPASWWRAVTREVRAGLVELVEHLLTTNSRA